MRLNFVQSSIALIALAGAATSASANLLVNSSFETPVTYDGPPFVGSWEAFNGSANSGSGNSIITPRTGTQDLAVSITNSNNDFAGAFQDVVGLIAGQTAVYTGYHRTPSSPFDVGVEARIEWRNTVSNTEVSRIQITPIPGADYTQFTLTAPVPAGADSARVVYAIQSFGAEPTNTGISYLDDVSFVVPEPTSIAALGAAGLLLGRKRRR